MSGLCQSTGSALVESTERRKVTEPPALPAAAAAEGVAEPAEGEAFWLIVTAAEVAVVDPDPLAVVPVPLDDVVDVLLLLLPPQAARSAEASGRLIPISPACFKKPRRLRCPDINL